MSRSSVRGQEFIKSGYHVLVSFSFGSGNGSGNRHPVAETGIPVLMCTEFRHLPLIITIGLNKTQHPCRQIQREDGLLKVTPPVEGNRQSLSPNLALRQLAAAVVMSLSSECAKSVQTLALCTGMMPGAGRGIAFKADSNLSARCRRIMAFFGAARNSNIAQVMFAQRRELSG